MSDNSSILLPVSSLSPAAASEKQNLQESSTNEMENQSLPEMVIQFKLSVGSPDEPLEKEADAMADTIMRMPEQNFIQRKCSQCEEEDKVQRKPLASFIQRKEISLGAVASDSITSQINSSRGSGSNMDGHTLSFMQSRFGADFSDVKIHTGHESVQMNRELSAKAFTVGNDIYFNDGQYNPNSSEGKHLLAHELTHTVQQGQNSIRRQAIPQRTAAQQIATTLRSAAKGWGTDEDAIFNALTGRTTAEIADIEAAFLALSGGETLEAMLRDELSGNDLSRALSLLRGETPSAEIARTLWDAMRGWGTDESAIYAVVAGRTASQWADIQAAYNQMTGNNLTTEIRDELTDSEWTYFQSLLPGAEGGAVTNEDRATVIANRLEAAMQGWGTDESAIYAALTGHSESELREIENKYRLIAGTGHDLNTDLRDELTDKEYEHVQQLLHPPGNPERLARRLYDAFKGIGADKRAAIAVLQGRTPDEIIQIKAAYQRLYGETLIDRLKSELGGGYETEGIILESGRLPDVVDEIKIAASSSGDHSERLLTVLQQLSGDRNKVVQAVDAYAARGYGDLLKDVRSELSGNDLAVAMEALHGQTTSGACSAEQRKVALFSISEATSMAHNAINKLSTDIAKGQLSNDVESALKNNFNTGNASGVVNLALAGNVSTTLVNAHRDLRMTSDVDCGDIGLCVGKQDCSPGKGFVAAWTGVGRLSTVQVCSSFFSCASEKSTTMLHEFVHHTGVSDHFYHFEPGFSSLTPIGDGSGKDSLDNADSYAYFAKGLW